jgi:glycosyltransferase involved in cell wall biosynthesis
MARTKLMWIGDYSTTGFGTVAKGLLRGLAALGTYDIFQLGINYYDTQDFEEPWRITPAGFPHLEPDGRVVADDAYGYVKADHWVKKYDPDIVIVNNDYAVAKTYLENAKTHEPTEFAKHRSIKVLYSPIDSDPAPDQYIEIAQMFDLNIAYSDWQRQLMAAKDPMFSMMPVLYHGYDHHKLYPMDKSEAKSQLAQVLAKYNNIEVGDMDKKLKDKFIVYFVGANQFRKDLPCLFRAYSLFHDDVPNAFLIPHTDVVPRGFTGWILTNLQKLTKVEDAMLMRDANVFTDEEMRIFYNAADVLAYPTRGEGFGLPSFEAMATKTPVVATRFGPQDEIHRDGRGYFIDIVDVIPGDVLAWSYFVLPDYRSLYKQLKFVHDNPEHVKETVDKAYEFVKGYTWDNQANQLDKIISKIPEKVADVHVQKPKTNSISS